MHNSAQPIPNNSGTQLTNGAPQAQAHKQSMSTKNKGSKNSFEMDTSQTTASLGGDGSHNHAATLPKRNNNSFLMSNTRRGPVTNDSQAMPSQKASNGESPRNGEMQQTSNAGPCTQYYSRMSEHESQMTAYKLRINPNNINQTSNSVQTGGS